MLSKFSRHLLPIAFAAILAGVASTAWASHWWGGYHWARIANPFTLDLGDNVSGAAWEAALATAASDWDVNNSAVINTAVVPGLAASVKNCRPPSGRVEVCNAAYGNNGWLGLASISITGGVHITKGYVKVNDTYFNTPTYNTTAWRNLVMCQEVGHTFGLDHQDENFSNPNLGTCMDYTSNPSTNQHPNAHDYEELAIIYQHLDGFNTNAQSTARGAAHNIDHDDARTWGQLVKQSRNGRTSIYELDHGGGSKTVTFVIWALEAGGRAPR
jgi:hypothetical protein